MGGPRRCLDNSQERRQGEVEAVFSRHHLNVILGELLDVVNKRVEELKVGLVEHYGLLYIRREGEEGSGELVCWGLGGEHELIPSLSLAAGGLHGGEDRVLPRRAFFFSYSPSPPQLTLWQFATLRPSAHSASEPALVLEISAAGYAYRLRPINQASRSQRVFYSLARSFAALPRIPTDFLPAGLNPEGAQSVESLSTKETDLAEDTKGSIFERLLEIGGREGGRDEEEELKAAIVEEPEPLVPLDDAAAPTHSVASRPPALPDVPESSIVPDAATVGRRPHIMSRNSSNSVPLRRSTASATSPPSSRPSSPTPRSRPSSIIHHSPLNPSSLPTSPTSSGASTPTSPSSSSHPFPKSHPHPKSHDKHHEGFPLPFSFIEADLPRLHANLHDRLLAFFGQKLGMRRVRLTVYPELGTWDKPLATKVVTTSTGGAFATNMEVRSKELRKLLEDLGEGVEALEKLRIRVVAELLEVDPVDLLSGGLLAHHAMKTTAEDDAVLKVGKDGGVHVISDIDDTVKVRTLVLGFCARVLIAFFLEQWTEVLGGTKTIFRNVFVRELHEIRVRPSFLFSPLSTLTV